MGKKKTTVHRKNISLSREGEKNPAYRNGITKSSSGYWLVLKPNHPNANINNRVALHRLIVEESLGRYLKKDEYVHHIDFDVENNNLENLHVIGIKKHSALHGQVNKIFGQLVKEGIVVFNKKKGRYERG